MKRYALITLLVLSLLTLFIMGGCSKNSPTEPDQNEVTELDKPYGGYTTSDDLPAFGDPEISSEFGDDADVTDDVTMDPEFAASLDSNKVNAYFIRILWGSLEFDSTATEVVDWSGSASVNKGILGVLKVIRFEPADHILLPRRDRQTVEWVSRAKVHFDGISLVIIDNDTSDTAGEFTISTGVYSRTFTFEELDSLEVVETVTESGQQISIMAYNKQIIPFGGGFFDGRWIKTKENGGKFFGRWINMMGTHVGHLKGIWGVNRRGLKVMFGKYIYLNGRFGGLLAGRWGYTEDSEYKGWLEGRWVDRNLMNIGTFRGHWKIKEDSDRHGFFGGKWRKTRP